MNYNFYLAIVDGELYDNAEGGGSDNTTDAVIKRNPNNYLAPIFGNNIIKTLALIAITLLLIIVIIAAMRRLGYQISAT